MHLDSARKNLAAHQVTVEAKKRINLFSASNEMIPMPSLLLLVASSLAIDMPNCVGGAHCRDGDTCCEDKSISIFYGCCSAVNPICCPDHIHCCTLDFPLCDESGGGCVNAAGELGVSWGTRAGVPGFMRASAAAKATGGVVASAMRAAGEATGAAAAGRRTPGDAPALQEQRAAGVVPEEAVAAA